MTIRNAEPKGNPDIERLRRKRDQAWEMAGLARQDGDRVDEERRTEEAREYARQIQELEGC
jgi:hypothetical protein